MDLRLCGVSDARSLLLVKSFQERGLHILAMLSLPSADDVQSNAEFISRLLLQLALTSLVERL